MLLSQTMLSNFKLICFNVFFFFSVSVINLEFKGLSTIMYAVSQCFQINTYMYIIHTSQDADD